MQALAVAPSVGERLLSQAVKWNSRPEAEVRIARFEPGS
jgi:hypothetical protein